MAKKRNSPPPQETLTAMLGGYWISQMLFVAARLGIADVLAKGPMTAAAIAERVKAHPPSLARLLRALASVGVFAQSASGKFRLNPLAQTLRAGRPGSLRDFALMIVDDYIWRAWGALEHGVRTGELPFDHVFKEPVFSYLQKFPDKQAVFSASMANISVGQNVAIANAYPFGECRELVDVGGAHGHLLAAVLGKHRKLRGILYDLPQVVARAADSGFVSAPAVRARCVTQGGDFFTSVPKGADAYMMKYIIHDWDDDKCVRILSNCREAMASGGRVLVIDHVIAPGNAPDRAKLMDINMMVVPGGQERSREEFRALLARAGLKLKRIVPTDSPISIVEAVRA
jgi:O-methyltransferase domain/Dimerisation domain